MSNDTESVTWLNGQDLHDLPVGSVVLDSGSTALPHERCAWTKTDDTELRDDDGERTPYAWVSIQWRDDRSSAQLLKDHGPITPLWVAEP